MTFHPSVLCPLDLSDAARGALRYAGAIAAHFGMRLKLLAVNDARAGNGDGHRARPNPLSVVTLRDVERFFEGTFAHRPHGISDVHIEIGDGHAATEILRSARELGPDLIVMGSHGRTGFRLPHFGSTTERVLRGTTLPVLVTPGIDPGPDELEDVGRAVRRILAPVDLTAPMTHQLRVARGLAEAISVPVLLLHVMEPAASMLATGSRVAGIDSHRRHQADRELQAALQEFPAALKPEALVTYGEPAEEIARIAGDRDAGLIVLALHSWPTPGPHMGTVTYRVLCLAQRLVLALPPALSAVQSARAAEHAAGAGL